MKLKLVMLSYAINKSVCFQPVPSNVPYIRTKPHSSAIFGARLGREELKVELEKYLQKRRELNADESAKLEVGKIVGGTRGNPVLEFISGAPVKERIIDEVPDVFDYTELDKYGCGYLVESIMDNGGRVEMYSLMNMSVPPTRSKIKPKTVPKLVIDRKGENDQARYSGLKVNQLLDDDEFGRKLEEVQRKAKVGELVRPKLMEEDFEIPFADKRNVSPIQNPEWTPQRLDEEGRRAGKAASWARKARAGEFKNDPFEVLSITGGIQCYSIITSIFVAFAFGNSTRKMFEIMNIDSIDVDGLLEVMHGPAIAFLLSSMLSGIFCSIILAPQRNRNGFVWFVKGWAGGPLAISQLKGLGILKTRAEADALRE